MKRFNSVPANFKFLGLTSLAIFLYSFVVWWPTRLLPYHWDSAGFFINAAKDLQTTHFLPWVAGHSDFAHPPLLMTYIALGWNLISESLLTSHLLMLVFLPLLMMATFLIAQRFISPWLALGIAFLTGFTPYILAEVGTIYIDLPVGALSTAGLAAIIYHKKWPGIILFTASVLVKESALLILPAAAYAYWSWNFSVNKRITRSQLLRKGWGLLIPVAVYLLWLTYHYQVTGWWLVRPGRPTRMIGSFYDLINNLGTIVEPFAFYQGRWFLTLLAASSVGYLFFNVRKILTQNRAPLIFLLVWLLPGLVSFSVSGEFGLRYGILLAPAYLILSVYLVNLFVENFSVKFSVLITSVLIIISLVLYHLSWYPPNQPTDSYEFSPSSDLSYQDMISIGQQAALYLTINFPQAQIYGAFPENLQLTQPYQGYVDQPLDFHKCPEFKLQKDKTQIIYIHPYSPEQLPCLTIIKSLPVKLLKRFESRSKWLELYLVWTPKPEEQK